jgi:hypothetical protein
MRISKKAGTLYEKSQPPRRIMPGPRFWAAVGPVRGASWATFGPKPFSFFLCFMNFYDVLILVNYITNYWCMIKR